MPFRAKAELRMLWLCVCVLVLSVCGATAILAQTETGQITGRVTDASGAVLPGATVSVKAVEIASERTVTTNREGLYVLPNLQPGLYEITVSATGLVTTVMRVS